MLKTRIISALILLPLVLGALWVGGWAFTALVVVLVTIAALEYRRMFSGQESAIAVSVILSYTWLWLAYGHWEKPVILSLGLPLLTLAAAGEHVFAYHCARATAQRWAMSVAGGLYLGIGGAHLLRLRWLAYGRWWLLLTLVIIWMADSGAYFVGRAWGRHKMAPAISPNKSWEGYIAGMVSGALVGAAGSLLWPDNASVHLTMWQGAVLGSTLAILTPLGDLFVSSLKREVGVKDTSALIPGHGGVLDRLDSLLWGGVLAWLFITWAVK